MAFINGSRVSERLNGTNNADSIWGNNGNDTLNAGGGNDTLFGGIGSDSLLGSNGNDSLYGGTGNDYLQGGIGNDYLEGGSGSDTYYFARGDGQDVINNEDYDGSGYADKIQFAAQIAPSDIIVVKNANDLVLKIKNTTDQLTVTNYFLNNATSGYAIENIYFSNGVVWNTHTVKQQVVANQVIDGSERGDTLAGDAGNDTIRGKGGNDALYGNEGNDTLQSGIGNDYLLGRLGNDNLEGDIGNDTLDGGGGNDILKGGTGNDYLYGDEGADIYQFSRGDGQDLIENLNNDTLQFASGISESDIIVNKNGNDLVLVITNSADNIRIKNYFIAPVELVGSIRFANGTTWSINTIKQKLSDPKTLNGTNNNDTLTGSFGNDTLRGNGGNDYLLGEDGNDLLEGGAGVDNLEAGAGNDTLNGGTGDDTLIDTSGGADTFIFERGSGRDTVLSYNPIQNNSQSDILLMGANITANDLIIRRNGNDLVVGISGTNDQLTLQKYFSDDAYKVSEIRFADGSVLSRFEIFGTENNDQIYGNSGNNNLKGLGGNDSLYGGAGNDTLEGGAGYDYLYGGDGNDSLLGGDGDDYLQGERGNNTLDGGTGKDVYYGGYGDDTFIFTKGSGQDVIYNYNSFGSDALRDKVLLQGLSKTDVTLTRNGYDLELTINGTNGADKLTIPNYFYANFANNNCAYAISRLVFADGSEYNASQIRDLVTDGQSVIEGSPNNDVLIGSSRNETLRGNDKDDALFAYEGNDNLLGNNGKDSLYGGAGNDTLEGGAGNDWLQGDIGADVYRFGRGSGQDTIYNFDEDALNSNADRVLLGDGITEANITLKKDGEDLVLSINNTTDSLRIQNYLRNNASTTFAVENIVFANGTTWTINTVKQKLSPSGDLLLEGTAGNDTLTAGAGKDTLQGGLGNDQLYGAAGNDLLEGGLGNDKLYGEAGTDTLIGGAGNDSYYLDDADIIIENANEGTDTLYVSSTVVAAGTDYQMFNHLENVVVTGTQSLRVLGNASNNNMIANNAGGLLFGNAGNDTLLGGVAQDLLIGGDGDDLVEGGAGDDRLQGNNGNNILRGGDGSDYYIMSNLLNVSETGLDIIQNYDNEAINVNADRIQLFDITSDKITLKREADHLLIQSSPTKTIRVENYFANEGTTSAAVEWIDFVDFAQNKIVESWDIATVKAKVLMGTNTGEALTAYSSDDVLKGNGGDDTLNGKAGNDVIEGGTGNDTLLGEDGNDVLNGGEGKDTLLGGAGNDVLGGRVVSDNNIMARSIAPATAIDNLLDADSMEGGAGDDTYVVDDVGDVVKESMEALAGTGSIICVSTATNGAQGNNRSYDAKFSADGSKVVFTSSASNLVAGDTNGADDIFVKDLATGAITRVNTAANGTQANSHSEEAQFSADGSKVLFSSKASNLVADDTNNAHDIFVKDLATGAITRVSTAANGGQANGSSSQAQFSADGSKVLFTSGASNLVVGDTNGIYDIFIKDLATGAITRVNTAADGTQANSHINEAQFSADGSKVLFTSYASNLVAGDTNNTEDVFVKDLATGAITRVSTATNGAEGNNRSYDAQFSADGSKVLFTSSASNLVAGDTIRTTNIFVKDLVTGAITRVNTTANGTQANTASNEAQFSADGSKVLFTSLASNLVAGDTNRTTDIFIKDLVTGAITRVSTAANGTQANNNINEAQFSADGSKVLFTSYASNLVVGDTNNAMDIFIKDLTASQIDTGGIDTVQSSISYTLGQFIENLTLTGTVNINGTGNELANVVTGNGGNNRLDGGAGNDTLNGGAGTDTLVGGAGNDTYIFNLGDGNDVLDNASEDNTTSADKLVFGNGISLSSLEFHRAATSPDSVVKIKGTNDSITIKGYFGNPQAYANATIQFADNTTLSYQQAVQMAFINTGDATNNTLIGGVGNDTLLGGEGTDTLVGGVGNDSLDGGVGSDSMEGGAGNDVYVVDDVGDVANESLLNSRNTNTINRLAFNESIASNMSIIKVTTAVDGTQANGHSYDPIFSSDGSKIIFRSSASNLVNGDTNRNDDIFIKDLVSGELSLLITPTEMRGSSSIYSASFSSDGNDVIFVTSRKLLNSDDIGGYGNVFIKNLSTGLITRVSESSPAEHPNSRSYAPIFSSDGTKALFISLASNLIEADTNGSDIFIKNLVTGGIDKVSSSVGLNGLFSISPNGENIIFEGVDERYGYQNLFIKNLVTDSTDLVSTSIGGVKGNNNSYAPVFSPDGSKVVFWSFASNLVIGDDNDKADVFIKDLVTGNVALLSTSIGGVEGNNNSYAPIFSPDGSKVAFWSYANNLVSENNNSTSGETLRIFIKDLQTGIVNFVASATDSNVVESWDKFKLSFSPDGSKLVFWSGSSSILEGDNNGVSDIFIKDLTASQIDTGGIDTVQSSITYTLGQFIENLTLTGTANINGTGNSLANSLTGNSANNHLNGGVGSDTYLFNRNSGIDTIIDNDSTTNNQDVLLFSQDIAKEQLWFSQSGNHLEVSIIGTNDKAIIQDWYLGTANQIEQIKTAAGHTLLNSQVQSLVQAMASLTPPSAGQTTLNAEQNQALAPVLATTWTNT